MNKPLATAALSLLFVSSLLATDTNKVIPETISGELKAGKKLAKVWFAPGIEKGLAVRKIEVSWGPEDRNSSLEQELIRQVAMLQKKEGAYTMKLTVVETSKKTFTGFGYILGKITIEGIIIDAGGKIVAAFQNKSKINESPGGFDYPATVDTIVSALMKDLL